MLRGFYTEDFILFSIYHYLRNLDVYIGLFYVIFSFASEDTFSHQKQPHTVDMRTLCTSLTQFAFTC